MTEPTQQQPSTLEGVHAMVQKVGSSATGQAVTVRLTSEQELASWYAELVLPQGATATAGPGTTVSMQGSTVKLTPVSGTVTPTTGGKGTSSASVAISGTQNAPQAVRVSASLSSGRVGYAALDGLYVATSRGRAIPASEQSWPGSGKTVTDPNKFSTGGGSGGGGGGGGGGQFSCDLFVDFQNQTVRHAVGSDAGGGGGSGGGGGYGSGYDQNNHQKQQ